MIRQSAILALLALLCAGQDERYDEHSMLHDLYLNKCNDKHRNSQDLEVYYYDSEFNCQYHCVGSDADGNYFYAAHNKDDGLNCIENLGAKEDSECLNGYCVLSSTLEVCENALGREVTAVDGKQCKLTCRGGAKEVKVQKSKGAFCTLEENPWRAATCTASGYCRKVMNNIPVSKDSASDTDDIAKAECERRHLADGTDVFSYRGEEDNVCEYACMFNTSKTHDWEYLTFHDGFSCGDGKKCLGGDCHNTDDINKCNNRLGEPTVEIIVKECTQTCVGETKGHTQSLKPNAACIKLVFQDEWKLAEGKCNGNAECVVDYKK